jgi:RNA polymerase sigma factor (sigma-70 family)
MDVRSVAIEELYRARYANFSVGITAFLADRDAAHDVVQEGFAQALASRQAFRGGSLEAWVWRIVVRKAHDARSKRTAATLDVELDDAFLASERDPELAAAIRRLPDRRRLIVFLRYFADLPYSSIAELVGVDGGTVGATLSQAHAELRRELELKGAEQ